MLIVRGDTHGAISAFCADAAWTSDDTLIITGDFGFGLGKSPSAEREKLDKLAKKPYQILFCAGNHENHDWLWSLPEEERYGASVRRIRDNIFCLQNGYVYTVESQTIFVMGGAASLEQDRKQRLELEAQGGPRTWFPQELPAEEEYLRGETSLSNVDWRVDVVLTHTAPTVVAQLLSRYPLDKREADLRSFLDRVYAKTSFDKWFFGHFHCDRCLTEIDPRFVACYQRAHRLNGREVFE